MFHFLPVPYFSTMKHQWITSLHLEGAGWILYLSKPHNYSCSYNKHTYVVCCLQSAVKGEQQREEGRSDDVTDSDDDREIYSSSTDEDEINAIY